MSSTTLSIALPLQPSLIAVICTPSPSRRPVTSPVVETVARVGASLLHVTDRPASSLPARSLTMAVNCAVWPITTLGAAGVISTEATEARGDVESLLHATTVAPHSDRIPIARTTRAARDMVPLPPLGKLDGSNPVACSLPEASGMSSWRYCWPSTLTGTALALPRWSPQQYTMPGEVMPHELVPPALRPANVSPPETAAGTALFSVEPFPSWPHTLKPQQ